MNEHEAKAVEAFILKEKRHRYRYFLDHRKKRRRELDRLNHCIDLDPRFAQWLPNNTNVVALLRKKGSPAQVYVISDAQEIDGKMLLLEEAVELASTCGWGTTISCVPGMLGFFYDEGAERKALLEKK